MRCQRGQAAPEYLATIAVVGTLLLATAAVAEPDLAEPLVERLRSALCIVAGDICRAGDAAAAGLDPCVVGSGEDHRFGGGTFLVIKAQGHEAWVMQMRSDGSVAFTGSDGVDVGGTVALGLSLAPGVRGELSSDPTLGWRDGKTWVFPSLAAARGFMTAAARAEFQHQDRGLPPATYEFRKGGGSISSDAGVPLLSHATAGIEAAVGRRVGRDATTWFIEGRAAARFLGAGNGVLEYSAGRDGTPRSLVVRNERRSGNRVTEIVSTLDLTDPANRSVADRVLALAEIGSLNDAGRALRLGPAALRALRERFDAAATVERATYSERRDTGGVDLSVALGVKVGVNVEHERITRRLESASVRFAGDTRERLREDCNPAR